MTEQSSMFGDMPSDKIQENVRTILRSYPEHIRANLPLAKIYGAMANMYGIDDITKHPEWPAVFQLICDAPTIQRRVRDFQNGSKVL